MHRVDRPNRRLGFRGWLRLALLALPATSGAQEEAWVEEVPYCGDKGVWLQILGSGGAELTDQRSPASYLLWIDENARLMVNAGSGAALRFDQAGADFADLDAIVFTHLRARSTVDFASLVEGSAAAGRKRLLPVLGPAVADGDSTTAFIERMIGADGLYPELASYLTFRSTGGYKLSVRDVPAFGTRRWAQYSTENIRLAAIPVHHGGIPALAWRVQVGDFSLVFLGGFSNRKNLVGTFAKDADALIAPHAVQEDVRGTERDFFATPSQLGRVAAEANVRMLILGNRTTRTLGRESVSRAAIEQHYEGPLIFADELECWGL